MRFQNDLFNNLYKVMILLIMIFSIGAISGATQTIVLTDVTSSTGIDFVHTDGGSGQRYVVETVSAGLALFDYDNDNDIDVYLLNGAPLKGSKQTDIPRNALYRNDGDLRFTDVTKESGLGDTGYGLGVAVADYDGDGNLDVYLNNHGSNALYRNSGKGLFHNVTKKSGVSGKDVTGAGVCFLDMDADGDLDLYVANYFQFDYNTIQRQLNKGVPVYPNPRYYDPVADILYRNNGDGTFTDVSEESGISKHSGWGMGIVCADYDRDGDTDVFVGNDVAENYLFQNDGSGKFQEVALLSGTAYDLNGDEQGSMGVDCGDFNNDGLLDFYVTSYQNQLSTLYQNTGDGFFEDVTMLTGAGSGTFHQVTWGNGFVDFDNDGDKDIYIACGHLQDNIALIDDTTQYLASNVLLENYGKNKYKEVASSIGESNGVKKSSRGAAFDDLDNDGDTDAEILNSRSAPTILRNDSVNHNSWIQINLKGLKKNVQGIGARVKVVTGNLIQEDEVHSGRGYQSHYGTRLSFGLGNAKLVNSIEVNWIGGGKNVISDVEVNKMITIEQLPQ